MKKTLKGYNSCIKEHFKDLHYYCEGYTPPEPDPIHKGGEQYFDPRGTTLNKTEPGSTIFHDRK